MSKQPFLSATAANCGSHRGVDGASGEGRAKPQHEAAGALEALKKPPLLTRQRCSECFRTSANQAATLAGCRRTYCRSATSAAGVTPEIRAAAPRVAGRAAASLPRISAERLPTAA